LSKIPSEVSRPNPEVLSLVYLDGFECVCVWNRGREGLRTECAGNAFLEAGRSLPGLGSPEMGTHVKRRFASVKTNFASCFLGSGRKSR